jgi:hypothetical protein
MPDRVRSLIPPETHYSIHMVSWCDQMNVEDEANCPVTTIYLTCGTVADQRTTLNLDPEKDGEKMATFSMAQITQPLCYADLSPSQYSTTLHRMPLDL